jgi:hypothetical protein
MKLLGSRNFVHSVPLKTMMKKRVILMTTTKNRSINKFLGFSKKEDLLNREYVWCETYINDNEEIFGYTKQVERPIILNYLTVRIWDKLDNKEKLLTVQHMLEERKRRMQSAIDQIDDALKSLEDYGIDDLVL